MAQDFNPDAYNSVHDTRSFPGSGLTAGVESGLGTHEALTRGTVQPEQMSHGTVFRQNLEESPAGSENGKNFTFRK